MIDVEEMPNQLELEHRYMRHRMVLLLSRDSVLVLHIRNLLKFRHRTFEPILSSYRMFQMSKYSSSSSNIDTMRVLVDF